VSAVDGAHAGCSLDGSTRSSAGALRFELMLTPGQLDVLADLVATKLAERPPAPNTRTWLTSAEAAEHLACSRDRVHDLVQLGKLAPRRDGRRLLFRRDELDAYLEAAA